MPASSALSAKTREVCRTFWRTRPVKGADGRVRQQPTDACCQGCPLRTACTSGTGTLTHESLAAWTSRVNAAAEAVTL